MTSTYINYGGDLSCAGTLQLNNCTEVYLHNNNLSHETGFILSKNLKTLFIGQNGEVTLNIDNWENIFILGGKNQKDILLIDKALDNSSLFKKQQVNFENYTL